MSDASLLFEARELLEDIRAVFDRLGPLLERIDAQVEASREDLPLASLPDQRAAIDRNAIDRVLRRAKNRGEAARLLGVSRPTLYALMRRLGMDDQIGPAHGGKK